MQSYVSGVVTHCIYKVVLYESNLHNLNKHHFEGIYEQMDISQIPLDNMCLRFYSIIWKTYRRASRDEQILICSSLNLAYKYFTFLFILSRK